MTWSLPLWGWGGGSLVALVAAVASRKVAKRMDLDLGMLKDLEVRDSESWKS